MINKIESKILDWEQAKVVVSTWKDSGEQIVFTNGCFDIMHFGHFKYLAEARSLGDRLIIGLNSTDSVRKLKGPNRPINDENTRLFQLASLEFVDLVVVFDQETPLDLIQLLLPDILVKGGDWPVDKIVGADIVINNGGSVKSLAFTKGYSTTGIIEKIKQSISDKF